MGMRFLPFSKAKKGWQFAGQGTDTGGGGGSYTLPVASANTLGGVKVGSGLEITNDGTLSASGGGGGGGDFSTSEQSTGRKWIDGKTIYFKTFVATGQSGHYYKFTDINNVSAFVIDVAGFGYKDSSPTETHNITKWDSYNNGLEVDVQGTGTWNTFVATVYYTKNS